MKAGLALALIVGPVMGCGVVLLAQGVSRAAEGQITAAQSDYLEQCGGCHGLQGDSRPSPVPVLRGRVGWFMCTREGRAYLGRLPNIAYAKIDDSDLAQLMNFVVFGLGAGTAPASASPFTAEEVGALRARPMTGEDVEATRKVVVDSLVRRCGAPASLRAAYDPQEASSHR